MNTTDFDILTLVAGITFERPDAAELAVIAETERRAKRLAEIEAAPRCEDCASGKYDHAIHFPCPV